MNLAQLIHRSAVQHRDRLAVVGRNGRRTYGQLDHQAGRLAGALSGLGLVKGDRVLVLLDNRLEYPEIDAGLAYGGFVRVALNARLGLREFELSGSDCDARALITEPSFDEVAGQLAERLGLQWVRLDGAGPVPAFAYESLLENAPSAQPLVDGGDDDPAWISYTSGTTGRPKGVILSHRALANVAYNIILETGPTSEEGSVLLPQPLSHGAGYFVLPYLASGASVHVVAGFDPEEILQWGATERVDVLKLVPTMLRRLLQDHGNGPLPFRHVIYGASPIPDSVLNAALAEFGPVLSQIYGQSEAPVTITCLKEHDHARRGPHLASAGRPWRSVDVRVVDADGVPLGAGELGEVVVRGQHLMSGYYGQPELTAEVMRDGWLWTKDLGIIDEDGFVYLRGRRDDMINSGGFNIAPKEVEEAILRHPAVQECAVVGTPDETWGQRVCAFVVPWGGRTVEPAEILAFSEPTLGFRKPRQVIVVDALPYSPYGKVDRSSLAKSVAVEDL